jgi:hypothetical protein
LPAGIDVAPVGTRDSEADASGVPSAPPEVVGSVDRPALWDAAATAVGDASTPLTSPAGLNGLPIMTASAAVARTMAPAAIGTRRPLRRFVAAGPLSRATDGAGTPVKEMPQPGHIPAPPIQHQRHA